MAEDNVRFLLYLSKKCGLHGVFETSTSQVADDLGVSQQTVSRKLRELEEDGCITREVLTSGLKICLSDKGRQQLEEQYAQLKSVFEDKTVSFTGEVCSGLGEGKYYISLDEYQKRFFDSLGFHPFAGTLNLRVDPVELKRFLLHLEKITIDGFETKERTYGGIDCYAVSLPHNVEGAIIVPHRTLHSNNIAELISSQYLRDTLRVGDGDVINVNAQGGLHG